MDTDLALSSLCSFFIDLTPPHLQATQSYASSGYYSLVSSRQSGVSSGYYSHASSTQSGVSSGYYSHASSTQSGVSTYTAGKEYIML